MTERLYYEDSYLTSFSATVVEAREGGRRIYLDRTAFYPASGGQPADRGTLGGIPVIEVIDEEDRIAHVLEAPLAGTAVNGLIDWSRRFDHMQQHSGQHLLSAVFAETFGFATLSFHLGESVSTIELGTPSLTREQVLDAERRANEIVFANRRVGTGYEQAAEAGGLRKQSERTGMLRIVSIEDLDRSACGGTHVRHTGEIGPVLLRKTEKIRSNTRVEFLCGHRAVARARADFDNLMRVAQVFSAAPDAAPELVALMQGRLQETEKLSRKLASELALRRGTELFRKCDPDSAGRRILETEMPRGVDDEVRSEANGFIAEGPGVYLAFGGTPPAVLVAASPSSGVHAGTLLKPLLEELGGRGGGSAQMAQGSVRDADALAVLKQRIRAALR